MDKDAGVPVERGTSEMSGIPLTGEEAELLHDPPEQVAEQAPHSLSPAMAVNLGSADAEAPQPRQDPSGVSGSGSKSSRKRQPAVSRKEYPLRSRDKQARGELV